MAAAGSSAARDGDGVTRVRRADETPTKPTNHPNRAGPHGKGTAYVIDGADLLELKPLARRRPTRFRRGHLPLPSQTGAPTSRPQTARVATDPWGDGPVYPVMQLVVGIDARRVVEAPLVRLGRKTRGDDD